MKILHTYPGIDGSIKFVEFMDDVGKKKLLSIKHFQNRYPDTKLEAQQPKGDLTA